ncbi:HNH endonuclease [Amycolatopsis sp. cmx-4-61]|uniref:HNH endonuclease n=1 Tax=Amycolatopsis sp. cmx-4-61 TaxID=2790937 RepID=UPI00397C7FF8
MSISDKDRKILWGRSGNRCALCRRALVAERTPLDREAVIGDEAHIAARSPGGSRYGECPSEATDSYENLILLCRSDHKKVDDQPEHYTAAHLRRLKEDHEAWIERTLSDVQAPIRFEVDADNLVFRVRPMITGGHVWDIVSGADRFYLEDLDEDGASSDDLDCSATFLQNAKDWGEVSSDVNDQGMQAIRQAKRSLASDLEALRDRGFLVFGGQRHGQITGGVLPPTPFTDAYLIVLRIGDKRLQHGEQAVGAPGPPDDRARTPQRTPPE